ncbi:hypothetical protein [Nocardia sp. R6R-6]|uniref:hypothetical protein n=1 Tax=Nocardia sp. R6R-6 TaxID=3459303 RepID=UPI00403D6E28
MGTLNALESIPAWQGLSFNSRGPGLWAKLGLALNTTAAIVLILGGILLLCRLIAGRVMVIFGAAMMVPDRAETLAWFVRHDVIGAVIFGLAVLVAILILVLAAMPATGRWIRGKDQPPVASTSMQASPQFSHPSIHPAPPHSPPASAYTPPRYPHQ